MPAPDKRVSIIPLILVGLGVVLMVFSLFWFLDANQKAKTSQLDDIASQASPRIPFSEIPRVRVGDAKAALELKQAVFIDTRGDPYFSEGHIPGALSITEAELPGRLKEMDSDAWFIPYCT